MRKSKQFGGNKEFWFPKLETSDTYLLYYTRLMEIAISTFEWENLPDTIDPRFLELVLFSEGRAVFFEDEIIGYLALRCITSGQWNVYDIPINREAFATNDYRKSLTIDDSVIIYNNLIRTPCALAIDEFAKRLTKLERSIDVNVDGQKTPFAIACDEEQRLTFVNLMKKADNFENKIFGTKNLDIKNAIQVFPTVVPWISTELQELKNNIWNEALTYLGISNLSYTKAERMVTDEVNRQMGGTIASRYSRLAARQEAAEKINKMFGLNVSVKIRDDFDEWAMSMLPSSGNGGDTQDE